MPLLPEGPLQAYDLRLLSDEARGEAAFSRLWELLRVRLERAAVRFGMSETEAEDVVQNVSVRLWERRHRLAEMSIGSFWTFAFRSVKNLSIDRSRQQSRLSEESIEEDCLPAADVPYVDAVVERSFEWESVYAMADRLWLGELDVRDKRLVLAVQMCLLEDLSTNESSCMLNVSLQTLEEALRNPSVVRHALYQALMWESDELTRYVLTPRQVLPSKRVEEILLQIQQGMRVTVGAWGALETAIIILRILYGMAEDDIVRALNGQVDTVQAKCVIRRAVDAYPFTRIAQNVAIQWRNLYKDDKNADLWRRLVFEYHVRVQLPHKQIIERVAPAALTFAFDLKPTTLNSWIGNGRLWAQIASFISHENASRS